MTHEVYITLRSATSALHNLKRGDAVIYTGEREIVEATALGMQFNRGRRKQKLVLFVRLRNLPHPIPHYLLKKVIVHS